MNGGIYETVKQATNRFTKHYGLPPTVCAYAPGRVEVLGNHTDYNEGFVLSAAINYGTCFLARPTDDALCRLWAADIPQAFSLPVKAIQRTAEAPWANYVLGVLAKIGERRELHKGFEAMITGDLPLGAGLSSSAALEVSAGLALSHLYDVALSPLDLARISQAAEHEYAGAKCGLLDQISSLYGQADALVMTDFRSLDVAHVRLGLDYGFLIFDTGVKHTLVESEYNERRTACEAAAKFFAQVLPHPVKALRDVSWEEWKVHQTQMPLVIARRAGHIIGENMRVLEGRRCLDRGDLQTFGALMYASHESSRTQFENSCHELDMLIRAAQGTTEVLGARLSGGGFGGSAVMLVRQVDAESVAESVAAEYRHAIGRPCTVMEIHPSAGARVVSV